MDNLFIASKLDAEEQYQRATEFYQEIRKYLENESGTLSGDDK